MSQYAIDRAQALIKRLRDVGIPAAIAGGYARDTLYGRPVKDADLFVEVYNEDDIPGYITTIKHVFGADLEELESRGEYEGDRPTTIYGIFQAALCNLGCPLDVILVDDLDLHIEGFPDDLSTVVLDGTVVDQSQASLADFAAQRITFRRGPNPDQGIRDRAERLQQKYKGFRVVHV